MISRRRADTVLTAAIAGLLAVGVFGAPSSATAAEEGKVKCYGVNACKGQGACGGKGHSCAGKNACKGQGYLEMDDEKACLEQGGSLKPLASK